MWIRGSKEQWKVEATLRDSWKDVFKNIPDNTYEVYFEESPKEEEHICLKATYDKRKTFWG